MRKNRAVMTYSRFTLTPHLFGTVEKPVIVIARNVVTWLSCCDSTWEIAAPTLAMTEAIFFQQACF